MLPLGWTTAFSNTHKKIYYVHQETGRRQYEKPDELLENDRKDILTFYSKLPLTKNNQSQSWRGFNNFMKQAIMEEFTMDLQVDYMNDFKYSVLDVACGTGGDVGKWMRLKATSYLGFDNCKNSIDELKNRKYDNSMTIDAFVGDFTSAETWLKLPEKHFDVISCQFAAHYAFSDKTSVKTFISGIKRCLSSRGRVLITTVDSDCWRNHKKRSWGPAKISDVGNTSKEYGDRYLFQLDDRVNAPEWWVHTEVIKKEVIAQKLDFCFHANLASLASWFGVDSPRIQSSRQVQWVNSHEQVINKMCPILDADSWAVMSLYKLFVFRAQNIFAGNSVIKDFEEWIRFQNEGKIDALVTN